MRTMAVPGGTIMPLRNGRYAAQRHDGNPVQRTFGNKQAALRYLTTQEKNNMGVKVKTKAKAGKAATKAAAKPAASRKAAAKADGKRAAARADVTKQRKDVAARLKKGEKFGEIAEALHVTPGRAKYLQMLNEVESGKVARISSSGNDEAVAKRIIAARSKQDEYSSWGWISARIDIPEPRVKALAEAHGGKVKGTHVAKERAAARGGKPAKGTKAKATTKGKKATAKNPSR